MIMNRSLVGPTSVFIGKERDSFGRITKRHSLKPVCREKITEVNQTHDHSGMFAVLFREYTHWDMHHEGEAREAP